MKSPSYLLYGRNPVLLCDLLLDRGEPVHPQCEAQNTGDEAYASQYLEVGFVKQPECRHADNQESQGGPDIGQECSLVSEFRALTRQPIANLRIRPLAQHPIYLIRTSPYTMNGLASIEL